MDHGKFVAKGTPQELEWQKSGDIIIVKPNAKDRFRKTFIPFKWPGTYR